MIFEGIFTFSLQNVKLDFKYSINNLETEAECVFAEILHFSCILRSCSFVCLTVYSSALLMAAAPLISLSAATYSQL